MSENIRQPDPLPDPSADQASVDWEAVKQAREIFHGLGKAIKALKIYPATSPLREKFFQETRDKLISFLAEEGEMILRVRRSELFYEGQEIYSNPVKEENFALRLHGDGVREIHFYEGLDEKELRSFIDVITGAHETADDDVTTLLWEKELEHIRYFIVEEGEEGGGSPVTPSPGGSPGGGTGEAIRRARAEESRREASGEAAASPGMEAEVESLYGGKSLAEIFVLTPEEVAHLKKEMEEETDRDLLSDMITMLFQILQVEDDLAGYAEVMGSLEHSLRGMILSGEFGRAIPILETLRSLGDPKNNHSPAHAAKAGEVIRHLGETEAMQELAHALNAGRGEDHDNLRRYLLLLDSNAILPLSDLLGTLDQMKVRRLLCESLAVLAKDHVPLLLKKLEDPQWYVVRNIVYILGRIGDERSVVSLKKVLRHPEIRVRKEVLHTLSELPHPETGELLVGALEDEHPQIRIAALRSLVQKRHRAAAVKVRAAISDKNFVKRELYEKKEYFETLGRLLGNEAIPFLREHLFQTSWWGRAPMDELRLCASLALGRIGTPEASAVLREGTASRDKIIRKFSRDALKEIEGRNG